MDAYNTGWTYAFWIAAAVMIGIGVFVLIGSFFVREMKVRDGFQAAIVAIVIGSSLYGIGLLVRGSRIKDDVKATNEAVGRARLDLEDANIAHCGRRACP